MVKLEIGEVELQAAIDLLKKISPEEQEAVILALEHDHPGIGDKARAALELEEKKVVKLRVVEPAKSERPEIRDKQGNLYRWVNGGYRRVFGVAQLKVMEQAKPEPEPEKQETKVEAKSVAVAKTKISSVGFQQLKNPVGIPASLENAIKAIDKLGAECRYDVFHDRIIVKGHECGVRGDAHENLENVTLKVRQAVLDRFGFDPSPSFTLDALRLRCLDHIFDPVRDYLDSLRFKGYGFMKWPNCGFVKPCE